MSAAAADAGLPVRILLVEDDPGGEVIVREEFADAKLANEVRFVRTVGAAADVIDAAADTGWCPDLVLLDVNLTGPGLASLAETAQRADGAGIRIVAMTESRAEEQILRSLAIPTDLYVRKPVDLRAVADVVRKVDDLALLVVRSGRQRSGIDRP